MPPTLTPRTGNIRAFGVALSLSKEPCQWSLLYAHSLKHGEAKVLYGNKSYFSTSNTAAHFPTFMYLQDARHVFGLDFADAGEAETFMKKLQKAAKKLTDRAGRTQKESAPRAAANSDF